METLLFLLPGLGCAVGMALCMGLMAFGMRSHGHGTGDDQAQAELAALRDEVARLRNERPREEAPRA
jgi:hypothetical protein